MADRKQTSEEYLDDQLKDFKNVTLRVQDAVKKTQAEINIAQADIKRKKDKVKKANKFLRMFNFIAR